VAAVVAGGGGVTSVVTGSDVACSTGLTSEDFWHAVTANAALSKAMQGLAVIVVSSGTA
jgi:imidazolonepropionase-like amidohydrolase